MLDDLVLPHHRARAQANLIKWMEDGTLRPGSVTNVLYQDFVKDPESTLRRIYSDLRLPLGDAALASMLAYLKNKPKGKFLKFKYNSPDPQALATERRIFQPYQSYFNVPSEV
jgi:hypothetical protein